MARRRDRGEQKRFPIYTKGGTFGPEQRGWILFADGEKAAREGRMMRIVQEDELLCYQLVGSVVRSENPKPSMDISETVLTNAEVDAVVGEHCKGGENIDGVNGGPPGRSHTAGMNERKRKIREALGLEAHDFVEMSRYKLNAFDPRNGRTVVRRKIDSPATGRANRRKMKSARKSSST